MLTTSLPAQDFSFISALIVDDEAKARNNLATLIQRFCPEVKIVGEASTVIDAQGMISEYRPQILFQDICMPGSKGIEFIEQMPQPAPEVVFVTAHDNYALRALKASALDYLLKPINTTELQKTIQKFKQKKEALLIPEQDTDNNRKNSFAKLEKIAVPVYGGMKILPLKNIRYIASDNSYSTIYTVDDAVVVCRGIGDFDKKLSQNGFLRVHNSYLVNSTFINFFSGLDGGAVFLDDGKSLPVAKRRMKKLKEFLVSSFHHF